MDTHFAVLPLDVIDTLVSQIPVEAPRFLRLPHPRTGISSLFLIHESTPDDKASGQKTVSKILEVQAVEPPNPRSWFMGDEVISDGKLLVMTPVDPLFLLIPILRAVKRSDGAADTFRPLDDIFEDAARNIVQASSADFTRDASTCVGADDVVKFAALECTKMAMKRLCQVKEITADITVFRYSSEKLIHELRKKVAMLSTPRITEMSRCLVRSLAKDGLMEDNAEDLLELGRTRLACELLGQYLPQDIREELMATYDLAKLEAHGKALAKAQSLASGNDAVIKKSKSDPATASGVGGKRKKETKGSQGVEKLRKANVNGMAKLSTFFAKKAE